MTEQNDTKDGKKKLTLSRPGRLELNKTVDAGQVRQSFSHGRTKAVAVEVRRKRTFKQADDGAMTEVRDDPQLTVAPEVESAVEAPVAPPVAEPLPPMRNLTEKERAARLRALEGARQTETEIAEGRAEREAMESRRRDEERRQREDEEVRRREEDERRRTEEEQRRKQADEAARRATEQAARLEVGVPAVEDTESAKPKAKIEVRAPEADESDTDAAKRPGGKVDVRKPAVRRGDSRRRGGKLTISQALNDEERVRSLASVRRRAVAPRQRRRGAEVQRRRGAVAQRA